ncbi:MAG: helix-turn-helix domain-containing protein, partial [Clostridia bacterium]|nr:helix-turn-helix domain-containing protein [Clostridia bacterium]
MTKRSIGEFMALLRKAAGYTQQEVAEKLNVSNRTLSSWETDRTIPDVLMLPVIAELYGITVDELLRGERNQSGEPARVEFTEKSQRSARKNRYGKFNARCTLYTGLACLCGLIFMLAGILFTFTSIPLWASILIWLFGGLGTGVFTILIFYELNGLKTAEGLVTSEDIIEENKPFTLVFKRKIAAFLAIIAIPFLIGLIIFSAYCIDYFDDAVLIALEHKLYVNHVSLISVHAVLSAVLLLTSILYATLNYKYIASEKQIDTRKSNVKLVAKIFGFGTIPVAVTLILFLIIAGTLPSKVEYLYINDNYDEFRTHMQTLTVREGDYYNSTLKMDVGEYCFDLSDSIDYITIETIDAGHGFKYGYYRHHTYPADEHDGEIVCKMFKEIDGITYELEFDLYNLTDRSGHGKNVVNLAYPNLEHINIEEKYSVETEEYRVMGYDAEIGEYYFKYIKYIDYSLPFLYLFIATTAAAFAACTTAYIVKR